MLKKIRETLKTSGAKIKNFAGTSAEHLKSIFGRESSFVTGRKKYGLLFLAAALFSVSLLVSGGLVVPVTVATALVGVFVSSLAVVEFLNTVSAMVCLIECLVDQYKSPQDDDEEYVSFSWKFLLSRLILFFACLVATFSCIMDGVGKLLIFAGSATPHFFTLISPTTGFFCVFLLLAAFFFVESLRQEKEGGLTTSVFQVILTLYIAFSFIAVFGLTISPVFSPILSPIVFSPLIKFVIFVGASAAALGLFATRCVAQSNPSGGSKSSTVPLLQQELNDNNSNTHNVRQIPVNNNYHIDDSEEKSTDDVLTPLTQQPPNSNT